MSKTPVMVLQELCQQKSLPPPTYEIIHQVTGTHVNRFDFQVTVNGYVATATGTSKQISKHKAANNLLMKFEELNIYQRSENPVQQFQISPSASDATTTLNFIGPLKDICLENKIPDAIFTLISDCGPPHLKEFTYECKIAGITTLGRGNTKKMAKHVAAREMMERIKDVMPELQFDAAKREEELKSLTGKDDELLKKYNMLYGSVVADKTAKVDDYPLAFKKLMKHFNLSLEDFVEDLYKQNEAALEVILSKLELEHKYLTIQDSPYIVLLTIKTDTPFVSIGMGHNEEDAKVAATKSAFEMMSLFMRLKLPDTWE